MIHPERRRENLKKIEEMDNMVEVVRCKDCKHRNNSLFCPVALLAETVMKTRVFDFKVSDDWFCADGERRADT